MTWHANNLTQANHCFFGSQGGVSQGKYYSLNVNTKSRDNKDDLINNLRSVAQGVGLSIEKLVLLNQGVSNHAEYVDSPSRDKVVADGLVTDKKGIGLCIRTADCAPILFEDVKNGVVGAAHAGWRGAFGGIIENVVKLMVERGACIDCIKAAIGPCIMQKSYETDANFYNKFLEQNPDNSKYFISGEKNGFFYFDLPTYCFDRVKNTGINDICVSDKDTYSLKDEYFSFRRYTHLGWVDVSKDFPTQISIITL